MSDNGFMAFLKGLTGGAPPPEEPRPIADKPWEDPSLAPPAGESPLPPSVPEAPAAPAVPAVAPEGPGSEVEAIIEALDKRNRGMVDLYGEGPPR
jgi:hypothetical protein